MQCGDSVILVVAEHCFEVRSGGVDVVRRSFTYYEDGGLVYWTMGAPVEETTIVNRCRGEDTHESRRRNGALPMTRALAEG